MTTEEQKELFYLGASIYMDLDSTEVDQALASAGLSLDTDGIDRCRDYIKDAYRERWELATFFGPNVLETKGAFPMLTGGKQRLLFKIQAHAQTSVHPEALTRSQCPPDEHQWYRGQYGPRDWQVCSNCGALGDELPPVEEVDYPPPDADFGDGTISPEEEERRAGLDHRGMP